MPKMKTEFEIAVNKKFLALKELIIEEGSSIAVSQAALCKMIGLNISLLHRKKQDDALEKTLEQIRTMVFTARGEMEGE